MAKTRTRYGARAPTRAAPKQMKRSHPQGQIRKRRTFIGALALLLVLDAVLVHIALDAGSPRRSEAMSAPTSEVAPSSNPPPVPTETESPSPAQPPAARAPTRIISALDGITAWRATTGTCPDTLALPELTTDSGATFTPTNATISSDVVALQSIAVEGEDVATMIGQSSDDCSPTLVRTFVAGDNYEQFAGGLVGAWYVDPRNRAELHSPGGIVAAPCPAVMALAVRDENDAAVLCDDQTIFMTTDSAASWSRPIAGPGAVNLTSGPDGYFVASVGVEGCVGVQIAQMSLAPVLTPTGCLLIAGEPAALVGNVSLSSGGGTLWLWAGDSLARSTDEGATWL